MSSLSWWISSPMKFSFFFLYFVHQNTLSQQVPKFNCLGWKTTTSTVQSRLPSTLCHCIADPSILTALSSLRPKRNKWPRGPKLGTHPCIFGEWPHLPWVARRAAAETVASKIATAELDQHALSLEEQSPALQQLFSKRKKKDRWRETSIYNIFYKTTFCPCSTQQSWSQTQLWYELANLAVESETI